MKREFKLTQEPSEFDDDYEFDPTEGEEDCPYMDILAAMTLTDKPFGFMWPREKMADFLKARGYRIIEKKDKDSGSEYLVACKSSDSAIPNTDHSNIKEVFDSEVMDIISKWLLKIAQDL